MKKVSIITPEEAALKVQDGDTIATGGFVSCACPETLSKACLLYTSCMKIRG